MDISKSIEISLIKRGWSKGDLAEKLDVSHQTVARICGNKLCGGRMLANLAKLFDMSVSEFIAVGEDNEKTNR